MSENKILYAQHGGRCYIKMVGEIRHVLSPAFDALLDKLFRENPCDAYVLDLSETVFIDSTNLGLLAKVARHSIERGYGNPTLVSINPEVNTVLRSMGFDQVFDIIDTPLESREALHELPDGEATRQGKTRLLLEAHQALMEMNRKNQDAFQNVVDMLKRSVAPPE